MAFWCYGKDGFCDKNMLRSELCVYFDGKGGEEREINENQTDAASDAPQWISVKNRLPKDKRNVLTINGHGEIKIMCLWSKRGELWTWIYQERFVHYNDITHWMPLPEPPKEAEDANR